MKFAIVLMSAVVLLLLAGVLPVGNGREATAVYYSPMMILLLGLLSGSSLVCCWRRRALGFVWVHLGVVIVLTGAAIGYFAGTKGSLRLSLRAPAPVSVLKTAARSREPLGFEVAAQDFEVCFYPPTYKRFRRLPADQLQPGQMPFEMGEEFSVDVRLSEWQVAGQRVARSALEVGGEWRERVRLSDGSVLMRQPMTPSHYGVNLMVEGEAFPVSINHPATCRGWRFYLTSYDRANRSYVELSARRDPGRNVVIAGIWMVMVGMFFYCFGKTGKAQG